LRSAFVTKAGLPETFPLPYGKAIIIDVTISVAALLPRQQKWDWKENKANRSKSI